MTTHERDLMTDVFWNGTGEVPIMMMRMMTAAATWSLLEDYRSEDSMVLDD
jgi:hypothetical protein